MGLFEDANRARREKRQERKAQQPALVGTPVHRAPIEVPADLSLTNASVVDLFDWLNRRRAELVYQMAASIDRLQADLDRAANDLAAAKDNPLLKTVEPNYLTVGRSNAAHLDSDAAQLYTIDRTLAILRWTIDNQKAV